MSPQADDKSLYQWLTLPQNWSVRNNGAAELFSKSSNVGVDVNHRTFLRICTSFALMCLLAVASAHALVANNTSLVGTVLDPSGNVVPGVKVVAVNRGTGITYNAATNADGYYSIDFIQDGIYDLTVEQTGFAKVVQKGIVVQLNQAVRTDVFLKVG